MGHPMKVSEAVELLNEVSENGLSRTSDAIRALLKSHEALRLAGEEVVEALPKQPNIYRWVGKVDSETFDAGLRHKNGDKPADYLKTWLSIFRSFAYATRDDSWGELEKLIAITMQNYVVGLREVEALSLAVEDASK